MLLCVEWTREGILLISIIERRPADPLSVHGSAEQMDSSQDDQNPQYVVSESDCTS